RDLFPRSGLRAGGSRDRGDGGQPQGHASFAEAILQRRKNDPVDAAMLREYGRRMDFISWQPPRHDLFGFRALTREVQALINSVAGARSRLRATTAPQP